MNATYTLALESHARCTLQIQDSIESQLISAIDPRAPQHVHECGVSLYLSWTGISRGCANRSSRDAVSAQAISKGQGAGSHQEIDVLPKHARRRLVVSTDSAPCLGAHRDAPSGSIFLGRARPVMENDIAVVGEDTLDESDGFRRDELPQIQPEHDVRSLSQGEAMGC